MVERHREAITILALRRLVCLIIEFETWLIKAGENKPIGIKGSSRSVQQARYSPTDRVQCVEVTKMIFW